MQKRQLTGFCPEEEEIFARVPTDSVILLLFDTFSPKIPVHNIVAWQVQLHLSVRMTLSGKALLLALCSLQF